MQKRCEWSREKPGYYVQYHDEEWGVPVHEDKELFEFLLLEGAQAGLSWDTVLRKRAGYRKVFCDFNVKAVSELSDQELTKIQLDPSIIRNRLKIESARNNARCFIKVQEEVGSFDSYIWSFSDGKVIQNNFKNATDVPTSTVLSDRISKDLKKRGFKFVGSTIVYAYLQAIGIVNDHTTDCFRHSQLS